MSTDFRAWKLFCGAPRWWVRVIRRLSTPTECTAASPNVNSGLRVTITCPLGPSSLTNVSHWWGMLTGQGAVHTGEGAYVSCLIFTQFCFEPTLLEKQKVYSKVFQGRRELPPFGLQFKSLMINRIGLALNGGLCSVGKGPH